MSPLEIAYGQLKRFARDFRTNINEMKIMNQELNDSYLDTIERLGIAAQFRDDITGAHVNRIALFSEILARCMGLPEKEIRKISKAATLHDIGKIAISDHILRKPGKLTREEFTEIKGHVLIGAKILSQSKSEIIRLAKEVALYHHERWDGGGYPFGLKGRKIPLESRIVGLTDTFDALTNKRPYKEAYPIEVAAEIIEKEKEKAFDPEIADMFLNHIDEFAEIKRNADDAFEDHMGAFCFSERDREQRPSVGAA